MPDPAAFALFLIAALALLVTPGPAVLYIVARSIDQGRRAGLLSALGVGAGTLVHVAAAALGISALLASSALAFTVVKYLGAAYLVLLGVRKLLARESATPTSSALPVGEARTFTQGVLVNVLNPKTALFFLAFLPQFVDPARGPVASQILVLGLTFAALGVLSDSCYALLASSVGRRIASSAAFQRHFAGGMYVALGVTAALMDAGE
ncbi:MAG TPA: LysE family translocator [Roseiflexaceae bacterium]|nr:LysE family translocator [Roseiflexaceae bacterium]